MAKIAIKKNEVVLRLDDVYTVNEKHLVEPFIREDGKKRYFGSFKFANPEKAEEDLKYAVNKLFPPQDTVFYGDYPYWEIDEKYGVSFRVANRVKFFTDISCEKEIPENEIRNFYYTIEVHLILTKEGKILVLVPRAIALKERVIYENSLFEDLIEKKDTLESDTSFNITDDDWPF